MSPWCLRWVRRTALLFLLLVSSLAAAEDRLIVIVPMGPVDAAFLETAKQTLSERLNATVRIDPEVPLLKDAWYAPRKRYRAEKILDGLQPSIAPDAWKTMVITSVEISTTKGDVKDWGIAGLGNIGGNISVASTSLYTRYSKSKDQAVQRFGQVVIHEFGHTLGLEHCEVPTCAMADFKGKAMTAADKGGRQYCLTCRTRVTGAVLKDWAVK